MDLYNRIAKLRYIPALIVGFVAAIPGNLLSKVLHSSSKVFLVGENGGHGFQDNGKYVFEELIKEKAGQTYWMTSEMHDYIVLNRQCRIGSVRGYYYYFRSVAVFYTHSLSTDIAPLANRVTLFSPLHVEISHGVEGFKRKIKTTQVTNFPADLYTCSNSFEKSIKHHEWNISNSKLLLTGVARYDGLVASPKQKKSSLQILYMPTWREWDYEDDYEQFKNSKTFQAIRQVCTSSDLEAVLVKTHSNLVVRLHPFFKNILVNLIWLSFNLMSL
ncbi:CDP-glycerol:poly(glycerophosphate) glycerophosphotransferase [Lacticaseibacillus paracasei subsp. paracasei Lpp221]|uniref:CDP-glycerol--poly(glycerophosphate) glycerophosphotransferase n=1 Tax=Lacticaseibacillus paracasei TaxID=1597 RepID=UPI00034386D6|nr:CDP-glycerol--poly(glycerophosphate) glycerophosphotransferase [Lacticaseibacillus paracasei]EPC80431.1 CDP-glycerol:poly(glycerophosphate) glycerophosphotransferase [Lacticaseibacillus paracasei subsp. paracasei Lpp221]